MRGGATCFKILDLNLGRCLGGIAVYLTHVGRYFSNVGFPEFFVLFGRLPIV